METTEQTRTAGTCLSKEEQTREFIKACRIFIALREEYLKDGWVLVNSQRCKRVKYYVFLSADNKKQIELYFNTYNTSVWSYLKTGDKRYIKSFTRLFPR